MFGGNLYTQAMEPQREKSDAVGPDNSIDELLNYTPEVTAPAREQSLSISGTGTVQPAQNEEPPAASPTPAETESVLNLIKS